MQYNVSQNYDCMLVLNKCEPYSVLLFEKNRVITKKFMIKKKIKW